MKKGTIKVLAVSGNGGQIFRNGDKVTEKQFPEGDFDRLCAEGYISPDKVEKQKTVKEVLDELSKMEGFADIDALVAGDDRKEVQEGAEVRKTEIRQASQLDAQKANEEKAKKAKAETLEKIENAKTVGVLKAILAGQSDAEILKIGAAKMETLSAPKQKAEEKPAEKKSEEKPAEKKTAEKKETPKK